MKKLIIAMVMLLFSIQSNARGYYTSSSGGRVSVRGYTTKTGTTVVPHQRTAPNSTKNDNWSHKGNVNPNTGKVGNKG